MLRRCYERTNNGYLTHGLRGIYVDSLWKGNKYDNLSYSYDGFIQFCIWVVKQKHTSLKNLTIERKNNDGPYSPLNCDIIPLNKQQTNRSIPTKRTKNASSIYYGVCFNGKNWMATYWDGYKNKNIQNKQNTTELECAFAYDDYIIKNNIDKPLNKDIIEHISLIDKIFNNQDNLNTLINPDWKLQGYPWELYINVESYEGINSIPFKHWKHELVDFDNAIVEIVDIFFFIVSSLISKGYNSMYFWKHFNYGFERSTYNMNESSLVKLFKDMAHYSTLEDMDTTIIVLGIMIKTLGWDIKTLYKNYIVKNALNIHRQNNGYKNGTYIKMWKHNNSIVEDNVVAFSMMENIIELDDLVIALQDYYDKFCK